MLNSCAGRSFLCSRETAIELNGVCQSFRKEIRQGGSLQSDECRMMELCLWERTTSNPMKAEVPWVKMELSCCGDCREEAAMTTVKTEDVSSTVRRGRTGTYRHHFGCLTSSNVYRNDLQVQLHMLWVDRNIIRAGDCKRGPQKDQRRLWTTMKR
jgi:hypothetical protein